MPSPNAVFTQLVSTTFRRHMKGIKDNVSKNNAFYAWMDRKNKIRKEDGGLSIVETLDYANNGTYQRYSNWDVLNVSASDVITSAEYQWRQIALAVVSSGLELRSNSASDTRIKNLAAAKIKNAMRTFKNNFSADLYSDGTLPNQIGGLQQLVSDTGTGIVGGIDSSLWPFWQNVVQSAAAPIQGGGPIVVGPTTIESLMQRLYIELTRGDDQPDLIVSDNNYFTYYEASQVSIKRYTDSDEAQGGFLRLKYKNADVIFDGGSGIPADHMYFLNTDYFGMVVHPDADLTVNEEIRPYNQDGAVVPILWMGNTVLGNRKLQGVFHA